MAGEVFARLAHEAGDNLHGIASVGVEKTVASRGLRGGAVDDGDIVRSDDDAVLAFLRGVLGDEGLFDDGHRGAY